MTAEHVIPKEAGNRGDWQCKELRMVYGNWTERDCSDGYYRWSFCAECHAKSNRYSDAFGDFAFHAEQHLRQWSPVFRCRIRPLNVLKRIAVMALAMCNEPSLLTSPWYEDLINFVTTPAKQNVGSNIHFYTYFNTAGSPRFCEPCRVANRYEGWEQRVLVEACLPPLRSLGYVITANNAPTGAYVDSLGLCEITDWQRYQIDDEDDIALSVPRKEVHTAIPLDYRTWSDVEEQGLTQAVYRLMRFRRAGVVYPIDVQLVFPPNVSIAVLLQTEDRKPCDIALFDTLPQAYEHLTTCPDRFRIVADTIGAIPSCNHRYAVVSSERPDWARSCCFVSYWSILSEVKADRAALRRGRENA